MANPPIVIGPFSNVPAPGSPIRSDWAQQMTHYVVDTPGMVNANGDTMTGALVFNMGTAQQLTLYTGYGMGVQSSVEYFRASSVGSFAWYQGGVHSDTAFAPGAGGTELMRLNGSSGLEIGRGMNYARPLGLYGTNDGASTWLALYDGSGSSRKGWLGYQIGSAYLTVRNEMASGSLFLDSPGNVVFQTGAGYAERARIDAGGNFMVSKVASNFGASGTQINADGRVWITIDPAVTLFGVQVNGVASAAGFTFAQFSRSAAQIGSITQVGTTGVAFNTTSDPRLKENLGPIPDAADRVQQLGSKAFAGRWKDADTGEAEEDGEVWAMLSSHDIEEVAPYAVTGERDAVTPEPPLVDDGEGNMVPDPSAPPAGKILPQQVDFSALVPLLTAALAQALDRIAALEAAAA